MYKKIILLLTPLLLSLFCLSAPSYAKQADYKICSSDALQYCYKTEKTHAQVENCMQRILKKSKAMLQDNAQKTIKNFKELNKVTSQKFKNPDQKVHNVINLFDKHQKALCSLVKAGYASGSGAGLAEQNCYVQTYCSEAKSLAM